MIQTFPSPLDLLGLSLRLPGADGLEALWSVLDGRQSTVRDGSPPGRWRPERFLSADRQARGTTYTFAGGYLDSGLNFDAAAFGMSRREAEQMDPQQRILLQVTWEALEDAGIPPSSLAGRQVGVYVGASATDYADVPLLDLASIDAHFMTGNSLAMVSNRISYAFDLKGPSLTVDTACSSSVVALAQAAAALAAGQIELAIVGGVNMLSSPAPFIGFSRAGMLSPTGRCRPFSAQGDGYVRAEGAVVIVLARARSGIGAGRPRGRLRAIGVNSDGRTNGISLPSLTGQRDLLRALYAQAGVAPDALAFVEAHGTGTRVGDPIEARAIGESLGVHRGVPLPIGSVKSNIGHLESASGLAGLAKLLLAMQHRTYPASLYLETPNPDIDMQGLGLAPAARAVALAADGPLLAGLCNYGFGGTNAHAILESAPPVSPAGPLPSERFLVISAHSEAALRQLAAAHAGPVARSGAPAIAAEARTTRDRLPHRLVLDLTQGGDAGAALPDPVPRADLAMGEAIAARARVAFVFTGNGCQWPGMGRAARDGNATFRATFDDISGRIRAAGGVCPLETMLAEDVAARLAHTSAVQPLLFTIQLALCAALAEEGLLPDIVLGHSVGEVAAAAVCGALTTDDAVRLIVRRSAHQEPVRGLGVMAVLACDAARATELIAGNGVDIAARNTPNSTTVSGPPDAMALVLRTARRERIPAVTLDIAYPFHSAVLEPMRAPILTALAGIEPRAGRIPMVSTVTGMVLGGVALDAGYWWSNIREPVLFQAAVEAAIPHADLFIEIGPRPILGTLVSEVARHAGGRIATLAGLTQARADAPDPIRRILLDALVKGAPIDHPATPSGAGPAPTRLLPLMHWNEQHYLIQQSAEAYGIYGPSFGGAPLHPLIGARLAPGGAEWRNVLSLGTLPYLAGHQVDGAVILPATAYIEMVLAVGRDVHGTARLRVLDLDIQRAMPLEDAGREVSVLWQEADRLVTIRSRQRFDAVGAFVMHAQAVVLVETSPPPVDFPIGDGGRNGGPGQDAVSIYAAARACRMEYAGAFRVAVSARRVGDATVTELQPTAADLGYFTDMHVIDPPSYDAALHGILLGVAQLPGQVAGELPIRLTRLSLFRPGHAVTRSVARLTRQTADARCFDVSFHAADGAVVAHAEGLVMRRVLLDSWREADRILKIRLEPWPVAPVVTPELVMGDALAPPFDGLALPFDTVAPPAALLDLAASIAARVVTQLAGERVSLRDPTAGGRVAPAAATIWRALLDGLCELGVMEEQEEHAVARQPAQDPVVPDPVVPDAAAALLAFAREHPGCSADLRLAMHALETLPGLLATGHAVPPPLDLLDAVAEHSAFAAPAHAALAEALARIIQAQPHPRIRPLRVVLLEPGLPGLLPRLLPLARAGGVSLTILAADVPAAERLLARHGARAIVPVLGSVTGFGPGLAGEVAASPFDLALCTGVAPLDGGGPSPLDLLVSQGGGAPLLLVAIPEHFPAIDLLHAAMPAWFRFSLAPELPVGAWPYPSEAEAALAGAGYTVRQATAAGPRLLLAARAQRPATPQALARQAIRVVTDEDGQAALRPWLAGVEVSWAAMPSGIPEGVAVLVPGPLPGTDDTLTLAEAMLRLREVVQAAPGRLYILLRGTDGACLQAIAAYSRCLMNEFPAADICTLRLETDAALPRLASALAKHLSAPASTSLTERELVLTAEGVFVPRAGFQPEQPPRPLLAGERSVLRAGGTGDLAWDAAPRPAPRAGEVEVEVAATGLNFRDVMLGLGVLDSEILGDGLTRGALGFEFSGHVARLGAGTEGFALGDPVMGFGAGAFASHLNVPVGQVFGTHAAIPVEAAATLPVAFVTAWYGLIERGGLRRGETVLIPGAAGGVGLAAVQIALAHGARVVAAAGTEEKRALLRRLGAQVVVDSRSPDIAELSGPVDVVLNSVAGDAMRAALRLVKPFGRFIELGKRDFLDNTRLGLRPFLRNVTYIGADIDQLLAHDPELVRRMLRTIMTLFEAGRLAPLPYVAFDGARVGDAFRLMQASGHIGKILVRPARHGLPDIPAAPEFRPTAGVHVVLGGTGGFGLATAIWLVGQGARTVIVASRRGKLSAGDEERVAVLRADGVDFRVEPLDVTHAAAVAAAFSRWRGLGPIRGVIHAAMVLEDGMIQGLTHEAIARVLAPKVCGMRAIEAATASDALQYLVAYSSATSFVGSPGQAAYVVGNAFLEGAVLGLRARGVPALAVGWGAISDVGVIARTRGLAERLRLGTGVSGVTSAEALSHLGRLLAEPFLAEPVSAYSVIRWTPGARKLVVLRSPYFSEVFAGIGLDTDTEGDAAPDFAAMPAEAALALAIGLIQTEVARILRLPPDAVDVARPLMEIGLDSLMALELRLGVEKHLGVELALGAMGGTRSVRDLAERAMAGIGKAGG